MRKTSIGIIILCIVIGIILGVAGACGVYFLTVGEVAWQEYIETKLVPWIVTAVSAIFVIGCGVAPVIKNILAATSKFNSATSEINATIQNGKLATESIGAFETKIAEKVESVVALNAQKFQEQDERLKRIEKSFANMETITRIGFGNIPDLVRNGYAAEIANVGKEDDEEQV